MSPYSVEPCYVSIPSLYFYSASPIMAQHGYKKLHFQMLDQAKSLLANEEYVEAAKVYKRLLPVDPALRGGPA